MLTLRTLLRFDAATCSLMGLLLVLCVGPIAALTALPSALLFGAGILLLMIAGYMAAISLPRRIPPLAARIVVLGNGSWIIASVSILAIGVVAPNAIGIAFVLAQAAAVALLTVLEHRAMRPLAPQAATA